jgi:integrase
MPSRAFTDRFLAGLRPDTRTDYFDATQPGLVLRVSPRSKSWRFHFLWAAARAAWTFGTYPATSLARARTIVDEAKAALAEGKDPRTAFAQAETFQAICAEWARREAPGLRSGADRLARLQRLASPILGRPIAEIRRSEIVRLLDDIEDTSGPSAADQALAFIRCVCNWHASRSDDFRSPIVRGMARSKSSARDRILTDDEIRAVWAATGDAGPFERLIRFLLLTAARRSEAAGTTWAELDGADWLLPAERNKTKLPLLRPLSPMALACLGSPLGAFVFSTDRGATPISGYSKLKSAFDRRCPLAQPWGLHDLRRTARSLMSRAGVSSDHAERCLGHVIPGVRGTYDRHEYRDEKAQAYEALARQYDWIVHRRIIAVRRRQREAEANG